MWGYGPQWGMGGWGGAGLGPIFMIFWLLVIVALIAGAVWLVRSASHHDAGPLRGPSRSSSLDILEERYARGEINRDEYLEKRRDMGG
jgi:putative membrane protein